MAGNAIRLANGQLWTAEQFLDHYFRPSASGTPTPVAGPPASVPVDMSWYMGEGPGRFYHPGMFKVINDLIQLVHARVRDLRTFLHDLVNRERQDCDPVTQIVVYFSRNSLPFPLLQIDQTPLELLHAFEAALL